MARAPGLSVRLKLTLSYAGFLMLAGALLLAAIAGLAIPNMSGKKLDEKLNQEPLDRELIIMGA